MPASIPKSLLVIVSETAAFLLLLVFLSVEVAGLLAAAVILASLLMLIIRFRRHWLDMIFDAFSFANPLVKYIPIFLAVMVFPLFELDNPYRIYIMAMFMINSITVIGLDYMVGEANLINFGFAGFYAIGAYTSALLTTNLHVSFWLALPMSGFASLLMGFVLGLPVLKTKGYYMALVTMAFGLIIVTIFENSMWVGGPNGIPNIPAPSLGPFSLGDPITVGGLVFPYEANFLYLASVILAIALIVTFWLYNSQLGLVWNAVRDDEIASKCFGINVDHAKLLAFSLGSFWGGISGCLYAHLVGFIAPADFSLMTSVMLLAMVIVGGMSNPLGVMLGAFLLTIIPEKFRMFSDYRLLLFGVIIVLMVIYKPKGILPSGKRNYRNIIDTIENPVAYADAVSIDDEEVDESAGM